MESTDSSAGSQQPNLPPGFRFHPTDEELVVHYLKKKTTSSPLPVAIIAEVDLYKFDPWELPDKATFGEQEWYFFSPRDRKYPNGARPNRAATSGYWKATGTDKPVLTSGGNQKVGVKKALVFYGGKPPKGVKTDWIMHEYRLADNKPNNKPPGFVIGKKNSLRLDDWVLCRIYKKSNTNRVMDHERDDSMDSMLPNMMMIPPSISFLGNQQQTSRILHHQHLPQGLNYGSYLDNNNQNMSLYVEGFVNANDQGTNIPNPSVVLQNTRDQNTHGLKRPPSLFWNEENEVGESSQRVHDQDDNIDPNQNGSNSIVTMLTQLPQQPTFGDATFRQTYQLSDLTWYS